MPTNAYIHPSKNQKIMYKTLQLYQRELRLKNYADNSINSYVNHVKLFLEHFMTDPCIISENQIKNYLVASSSLAQQKQRTGAIKLYYKYVVKQVRKLDGIEYPRRESKLPVLLSIDELKALFASCSNLKHKAILMLLYSTGIRESELINLKIQDIDSRSMLIHIRNAKGMKDRFVPLSEKTLSILRLYFKQYRPTEYLFNGQFTNKYSASSIRQITKKYAMAGGVKKNVYPHLIRHCCATHLFDAGTDISVIQRVLGHKSHKTTMRYAQMSTFKISQVNTPDNFL
jgi:integrase/recombinase XerD